MHARQVGDRPRAFDTAEAPLIARHGPAGSFDRVPDRQHVFRRVRIHDGVRRVIAIRERVIGFLLRDNEITPHESLDRLAVVGRRRRVHADEAGALRDVELPADPQQREALIHQKPVAHLGRGRGIGASSGVIEEAEHAFAAAVGHFVEHGAVAALHSFRLDEKEVRRELDLAARVARGLVEVGHDLVRGQRRIDREINLPGDFLVRPCGPEGLAVQQIAARLNLDPHDFRRKR